MTERRTSQEIEKMTYGASGRVTAWKCVYRVMDSIEQCFDQYHRFTDPHSDDSPMLVDGDAFHEAEDLFRYMSELFIDLRFTRSWNGNQEIHIQYQTGPSVDSYYSGDTSSSHIETHEGGDTLELILTENEQDALDWYMEFFSDCDRSLIGEEDDGRKVQY